jgi:hypothetical protein
VNGCQQNTVAITRYFRLKSPSVLKIIMSIMKFIKLRSAEAKKVLNIFPNLHCDEDQLDLLWGLYVSCITVTSFSS